MSNLALNMMKSFDHFCVRLWKVFLAQKRTCKELIRLALMKIFITLGGYIFLGQMVSVGNYEGVVFFLGEWYTLFDLLT